MRALSSEFSLCSPLVALVYCYLIHTVLGSSPPPLQTVIRRQQFPKGASISAAVALNTAAERTVKMDSRQGLGEAEIRQALQESAVWEDSSSVITEDKDFFPRRVKSRMMNTEVHSSISGQASGQHSSPPLVPPAGHSQTHPEAKVKWAVHLQAKEMQRLQEQDEKQQRYQACTQTHFPKHSFGLENSASFSLPCDDPFCESDSEAKPLATTPLEHRKSHKIARFKDPAVFNLDESDFSSHTKQTETGNDYSEHSESFSKRSRHTTNRAKGGHAWKSERQVAELDNRKQTGHVTTATKRTVETAHGGVKSSNNNVRSPKHLAQFTNGTEMHSTALATTFGRRTEGNSSVKLQIPVAERTFSIRPIKLSRSVHSHYLLSRRLPQGLVRRSSRAADCPAGQQCQNSLVLSARARLSRRERKALSKQLSAAHVDKGSDSLALPNSLNRMSVTLPADVTTSKEAAHNSSANRHRHNRGTANSSSAESHFGKAVYFSGKEVLKLKSSAFVSPGKSLPMVNFTLELWVRPEGGQYDPAVILALSDSCGGLRSGGHWALGLKKQYGLHEVGGFSASTPTDATYFFSLKTARATRPSTVVAHQRYQPSAWTHLVASYDGRKMALYVNGALLSVSHDQSREVFTSAASHCMTLTLGGLPDSATAAFHRSHLGEGNVFNFQPTSTNFRGTVDELWLWQRTLSHSEIRQELRSVMSVNTEAVSTGRFQNSGSDWSTSTNEQYGPIYTTTQEQADAQLPTPSFAGQSELRLYLHDTFDDGVEHWWVEENGLAARLVQSQLTFAPYDLTLAVPLCGQTACDNPDVVLSYASNWQLRSFKQVRYRVINLMNDDGSNPTVSEVQILRQHDSLNRAFRPYNISFLLNVQQVRNSTLRKRLIMFGCEPDRIGDGICNQECMHTQTGLDGGDCDKDKLPCQAPSKGNGRCDFQCNKRYHHWDGGDCCLPGTDTHYTCYDPSSPYRAYISVDEFRQLVGLRSDHQLNVYIAVYSDWSTHYNTRAPHLIGLATFPWEKHVYSVQGGTVIQLQTFGTTGQMDSLVHEVGHNLGLWHVHHGVSEVECSDPCAETQASIVVGDLCADTAPTSHNVHCRDPDLGSDHCGVSTSFNNTPFRNYMSYADDNCTDHFTEQQTARMHCYLDLAYQPWRISLAPSPVPLPPQVVSADTGSVTVAWVAPLGRGADYLGSVCSLCDSQGALVQFAAFASSPAPSSALTRWSPQQATGPPDAEPCVPSTRAWLPDVSLCNNKTPCRLDLKLQVPVFAQRLTLWVTWNAGGVRKIRLLYEDGSSFVLKVTPAFCDLPFTSTLTGDKRLQKVQVFTRTPFTAIDAMQVISLPRHASCQACQPISYRVFRKPALTGQNFRLSHEAQFTDHEVGKGTSYLYWVEAVSGSSSSRPSPALNYTHGGHFCGDGHVDRHDGEDCDDGNILSGDGCDTACRTEPSFHCQDSPSLCYRHDGDGVCEDFERQTSVLDCGFYTPEGYLDQWAHHAVANPRHQHPTCPARVATGPPDRTQRCGPVVDHRTAWFPCGTRFDTANFWIELYVPRPVVVTEVIVHLASDGRHEADPTPKKMKVHLIKEDNSTVTLTEQPVILDCRQSQLQVAVVHDLSKPFYKSRGVRLSFRSHNISVAAVRLRSSRHLDPVTIATCSRQEVYNPHTGICHSGSCTRAPCSTPVISHGSTHCTGDAEGDVCVVTCQTGYQPEGPTMEITCRGGHWVSSHPVSCRPVDCGRPTLSAAVLVCSHGTTYGLNCTFRCQPPATLHGSDNLLVCEEDGLWSTPNAQCLVTCPPPLHLQHVTRAKKRCRHGSLAIGSRCKMRCKRGYHVAGARRLTRRVFRVTCAGDGTWTGGRCQRVTCPKFDPIFTGLLSCTNDVRVASQCSLRCPGSDEIQTVTCNANGQWNKPLLRCRQFDDVTCPQLHHHLDIIFQCPYPAVGVQCSVMCPTPDEVAVFSTNNASVDGLRNVAGETVNSITCTGRGQWFPPLERIICIEKCSTEFIGDTWCDGRNNRQYCQWDGGDCCQTTLGAKVKPFPQGCTEADHCTCKDPRAAESRAGGRSRPKASG